MDCRQQMDYVQKVRSGLIKPEEENQTVDLYDNAPGQGPTKIKPEELVTITSSVKSSKDNECHTSYS